MYAAAAHAANLPPIILTLVALAFALKKHIATCTPHSSDMVCEIVTCSHLSEHNPEQQIDT